MPGLVFERPGLTSKRPELTTGRHSGGPRLAFQGPGLAGKEPCGEQTDGWTYIFPLHSIGLRPLRFPPGPLPKKQSSRARPGLLLACSVPSHHAFARFFKLLAQTFFHTIVLPLAQIDAETKE